MHGRRFIRPGRARVTLRENVRGASWMMKGRGEMTDRAKELAKANTKPGDLRAEMAKRVGLTVEEQNRCRREGASFILRALRSLRPGGEAQHILGLHISAAEDIAERRWGPDWEVDG